MKKLTFEDIEKHNLLIFKYLRGSHSHGTATETSDIDEGGIYIAPIEQLVGLGLDYQDQVADEKNDKVWFELNKFFRLLLKSNPTILEALYIPDDCVLYEHPIMTEIRKHRDLFLTKQCFKSFGAYSIEQIKKCRGLNKKIVNPVEKRLEPLDFAYTFYKQGSTNIKNWLEHRNLKQEYCGLVNIPNMHDVYGCYYDWGKHLQEENVTLEAILKEIPYRHEVDNKPRIVARMKEINDTSNEEYIQLEKWLNTIYFRNMCELIWELSGADDSSEQWEDAIEQWYYEQKPIGYSGMVGNDGKSNELRLSSVSKGERPICWVSYNKDGFSKHCTDYKNYQNWIKHRNPVRYESNLNKNYDAKNVSEAIRLMLTCIDIAKGKGCIVKRTEDRELLLDIKKHKYEYEEVIAMMEEKKAEMEEAIASSTLPEDIDCDKVNDLLISIRKQQFGLK